MDVWRWAHSYSGAWHMGFLGLKAGNQIEAVFKFESKRKH